jgi:hypothetical protein
MRVFGQFQTGIDRKLSPEEDETTILSRDCTQTYGVCRLVAAAIATMWSQRSHELSLYDVLLILHLLLSSPMVCL